MVIRLTQRIAPSTLAAYPRVLTNRINSFPFASLCEAKRTGSPPIWLCSMQRLLVSPLSATICGGQVYVSLALILDTLFRGRGPALAGCIILRSSDFPPRRLETARQPSWLVFLKDQSRFYPLLYFVPEGFSRYQHA